MRSSNFDDFIKSHLLFFQCTVQGLQRWQEAFLDLDGSSNMHRSRESEVSETQVIMYVSLDD